MGQQNSLLDLNHRIEQRYEWTERDKHIPEYQPMITSGICTTTSISIGEKFGFPSNILRRIDKKNSNKSNIEITEWDKIIELELEEILSRVKLNRFSIQHYLNHIREDRQIKFQILSERSNFKLRTIQGAFIIKNSSSKRQPSRDCIIGLSFAFRFNLIELNYLLKAAGYNELYLRNKRDLIIAKGIQDVKRFNYNIKKVNDILEKYECSKVGNRDEDE